MQQKQMFQLTRRDGKGEILFGAGHEYHDMQTLITYTHKRGDWKGPVPMFAGKQLPRTMKKLKEKQQEAWTAEEEFEEKKLIDELSTIKFAREHSGEASGI